MLGELAPGARRPGTIEQAAVAPSLLAAAAEHASAEPATSENSNPLAELQTQARQIAEHLRDWQRDLDRRESQWSALVAASEQEARQARLWFLERQHEHEQQEIHLRAKEAQLAAWQIELDGRRKLLEELLQRAKLARHEARQAQADLAQREQQASRSARWLREQHQARCAAELELLHLVRAGNDQRLAAIARQAAAAEARASQQAQEIARQQAELEQYRKQLEDRAKKLQVREAAVDRALRQLQDDRLAALAEWETWREQAAARDRQRDAQWRTRSAELLQRQAALDEKASDLVARQIELHRLGERLRLAKQEVLEMHAAVEVLWGQLVAVLPAADVDQSVGRIRQRLAEHFQESSAELARQKKELHALQERLAGHLGALLAQRGQLLDWFARQRTELDLQRQELADRQDQLDELSRQIECRRIQQAFEAGWHAGA
jgi:hypothetical protein